MDRSRSPLKLRRGQDFAKYTMFIIDDQPILKLAQVSIAYQATPFKSYKICFDLIKMSNKNVNGRILRLVAQRIKPSNQSIYYQNSTCQTCIRSNVKKNPAQQKPMKKHENSGHAHKNDADIDYDDFKLSSQGSLFRKQMKLCSSLYSLSLNQPKHSKFHKNSQDEELSIFANHQAEGLSLQTCKQYIRQWVQNLIDYVSKEEIKSVIRQPLPLQQNEGMKKLRSRAYDALDVSLTKSMSTITRASPSESCKMIESGVMLSSHKILNDKNDEKEDYLRMLYAQALSIEIMLDVN